MSTATLARASTVGEALRSAVACAASAPSVRNTQPWRFRLVGDSLELRADWTRQLPVLDPAHRQLLISCGCALFNARVALAAAGFRANVRRLPDPAEPRLLARITVSRYLDDSPIAALSSAVQSRKTNRLPFTSDAVPTTLVDELIAAAEAETAGLLGIGKREHQLAVGQLIQQAAAEHNVDSAHRAELRAWSSADPSRRDGVLAETGVGDELRLCGLEAHGASWQTTDLSQCLLLLTTTDDSQLGWLRAGEALERLWLIVTRYGYALSLLTQVVELPHTRRQLRAELGLSGHPLVLLRVGKADSKRVSRRRSVAELIEEHSGR